MNSIENTLENIIPYNKYTILTQIFDKRIPDIISTVKYVNNLDDLKYNYGYYILSCGGFNSKFMKYSVDSKTAFKTITIFGLSKIEYLQICATISDVLIRPSDKVFYDKDDFNRVSELLNGELDRQEEVKSFIQFIIEIKDELNFYSSIQFENNHFCKCLMDEGEELNKKYRNVISNIEAMIELIDPLNVEKNLNEFKKRLLENFTSIE